MNIILDEINKLVEELRKNNSSLYKIEALKKLLVSNDNNEKVEIYKKILKYTFDSSMNYNISSASIKKILVDLPLTYIQYISTVDIFTLLEDLAAGKITGNIAIGVCRGFIKRSDNIGYEELIYNIIDKDLKCGASATTINKVIPNLIPTFNVCLANKYDKNKHPLNPKWYIERKLDGVRCICICKNKDDIKFYSRQGKEFNTLDVIKTQIQKIEGMNFPVVLDGEICLVDEEGNENFQGIMKEIRKDNHTISNPLYNIFDILTLEEFFNKEGTRNYTERYITSPIRQLLDELNSSCIKCLKAYVYLPEEFARLENVVIEKNWEGLMLRADVGYSGKRTNNLLKVKKFHDAEYKVIKISESEAQEIINGVAIKIPVIGALTINHKGNEVSVGSGLSLTQRKEWFKDPSLIIGKIITVKYFEETQNQEGSYSLRFPTLKCVHGNEREE